MSTGSSYVPHSQTAGISHYSHYHSQAPTNYHHGVSSYGYPYGGTSSAYSTSQPTSVASSLMPISLATSAPHHHGYHPAHSQYGIGSHQAVPQTFDLTGQIQPVNCNKPKVTATLWEDEGTLCFQVEARGVVVARREDTAYINGTKLLNVCGMTRGRRDGILKSEKNRSVVKIGPMHLKGVWIPFEKALEFANKEKITDILYPLFVHDISQVMMVHGASPQADHLRSMDNSRFRARMKNSPPGASINQIPSQIAPTPLTTMSQAPGSRPTAERSHTFPTPPTSASSASATTQNNSYDWNNQSMGNLVPNAPPLVVDTSSSNSRSLPNTPASTPPGNAIQAMQPYHSNSTISQYSMPPALSRYGQANQYIKSEMGPPTKSSTTSTIGESDQHEIKQDPYTQNSVDNGDTSQDDNYPRGNTYMNYNGVVDNTITTPDQVNGSPHQSSSGRGTPRSTLHSQGWSGYNAPSRPGTASYSDTPVTAGHGTTYPAGSYTPTSLGSGKRAREEDDHDYKPMRSGLAHDTDPMKRRRGTDNSISSISGYDQTRLPSGNTIMSTRI